MENHTLMYARFMNNDRTTIVAEWSDNENPEIIRETYIVADESDVQFAKLLELIELDQIHENTIKFYKKANRDILKYMEKVAEISHSPLLNEKPIIQISNNMSSDDMTAIMKNLPMLIFNPFDSEKYTESLFNLKLSVFELDFVKQSKKRKLKSEIRKAETPLQILNATMKIYNEIYNGSNNPKDNKTLSA